MCRCAIHWYWHCTITEPSGTYFVQACWKAWLTLPVAPCLETAARLRDAVQSLLSGGDTWPLPVLTEDLALLNGVRSSKGG